MRKIIRLQDGWKFHRGDVEPHYPKFKGVAYVGAKTERAKQGPACKDYIINDPFSRNHVHSAEDWETVSVPHDYHAADGYDPNENEALGFCRYENGWYVLRFTVSPEEADRRLTLYFEGVTTHATVWLNGFLMKHNFCGYTSFEVDITDAARVGEENVLSVYVSTEETEGWWYEGGGITQEEQKKIFEPFYSSKNSNTSWGMGLYHVRTIVRAHVGSLRVESQPGKGTSFFVLLPKYVQGR